MTVEQFLERLQNVRSTSPGQWQAECPAHDDRKGSLVVTAGETSILFKCHADCNSGRVLAALGVEWREMFYGSSAPQAGGAVNIANVKPAPTVLSQPSRRRDDRNAVRMPSMTQIEAWERALLPVHFARLGEVKGWTERTLRSFRAGWDGTRVIFPVIGADRQVVGLVRYLPGGDPKSMAVGERELFPAPESLLFGADVWLVEGEPDAVSARELGMQAVAVPGVGKWRPEWAERFRGRRVTVCMDCDEQGRAAAAKRVRDLQGAGVDARGVDLHPGRSDGYDLGDALVAARSSGRVPALCDYLIRLEASAWSEAA
jgi:hypothetical protein